VHRRWPGSKLIIDEGDGHGGTSMVRHWRDANDQFVASVSS
jgi:proline iminopeptidase